MIGEILMLLKAPVSGIKNSADERNLKKEAIIAVVLAVVVALVTILNTYFITVKAVNKIYKSLEDYNDSLFSWQEEVTKSEFKKLKKEAKKKALDRVEFGEEFFKTLGYTAIAIAVVAGILFVISRVMQSPKDYIETLAMSNRAFVIYVLGFILNLILSRIYTPIGVIVFLVAMVYAIIALATAFKESIEISDSDKYTIVSTIVIGIVIAVLVFIANNYINDIFGGLL